MEETLGKRIAACRKGLGLTQDALAEKLGVTAQAVSKWENDQSCPDITMLPKLAEIFSITTDELLGHEPKRVVTAEVIREAPESSDPEPEGLHIHNGQWELSWDGGRKSSVAFALWVLLIGSLLLAAHFDQTPPYLRFTLWDLLWTTGLLVFGLAGIFPRFSVFRFGCAFFGGYFLLEKSGLLQFNMGMDLILPLCLLLFGAGLLVTALEKPRKGSFHIHHNGVPIKSSSRNYCNYQEDAFSCSTCFGENDYLITLPRLSGGEAEVAFGSLTVDLSGCEELAPDCRIQADCSFGEMTLLIPRWFRVELNPSSAFGSVEQRGTWDPEAARTLSLNCNASFGQITVRYI